LAGFLLLNVNPFKDELLGGDFRLSGNQDISVMEVKDEVR